MPQPPDLLGREPGGSSGTSFPKRGTQPGDRGGDALTRRTGIGATAWSYGTRVAWRFTRLRSIQHFRAGTLVQRFDRNDSVSPASYDFGQEFRSAGMVPKGGV